MHTFTTSKKAFQAIGALGPYILAVITAIYLYAQHRITYLQIFSIGLAINLAINFAIKSVIQQPRPKQPRPKQPQSKGILSSSLSSTSDYEFGLTETGKRQGADRYGMPSGHAQTVGYILAFMSPIFTSTTTAVFPYIYWFAGYVAIATTTVLQRVAHHHHTILQVGVGLIIGALVGTASYRFAKRRIKEQSMKTTTN